MIIDARSATWRAAAHPRGRGRVSRGSGPCWSGRHLPPTRLESPDGEHLQGVIR